MIVVVDNLDRLSGKDALTALGEIRALLDIKDSRCVFMIPIDRRRLSDHLQEALKSEAAADFLEKFFGLDLAVTQPEEVDLRRWAQQKAASLLPKADATELERMADVVVSAAGRFPRLIVRVINGAVTRHRVVTGMGRSLTLAQAALVEGVIVLAPSSLRNLEENPRALTDARDWIESEHQGPEWRLATALGLAVPDKQPPHPAVSEVLRFLRGTLDVPLAWEDVRVALALRKNRLWSLVPDWETFSAPMEEGNIEAFSDALSGRPDRDVIIQSAVQALIELRASTRLPNGIRVLAPYLDQPVPQADRLRELALAHFASNSWAFRRITDASARFLLDAPQPKLRMVSVSFVEAISETGTKIPHDPGITRAAVALRSLFTDQQVEAVRKELATWSREELKPLFADPSGTDFINGPVASLVISPLAAWDASVPDSMDKFVDMAEQLREARDHGWYEQAGLDQIATQMAGQLTAMAANEPALPVGEAIVELLRDAEPSAPLDALAQGLAQEFANGSSFFHWAFRLKMSDSGMTAAIARFDGFAKSVSLEKIPPVLDEHRALIDASASNFRQLLLGRWQTHGHELAATIAIEGEAGASSLVDAWRSAPVGSKLTRAQQAMTIFRARGDDAAVQEIATELEAAVLKAPFDLAGLEELTTWMLSSQVSRQHLVRGITAKIESLVSPSDLPPLLKAVLPKLPDFGVDQRRQIADALADKITQVGTFDPAVVGGVVPSMSASEAREDLVIKMLEAGHSLDATLEALDRCRPKVGPSGRVHDALVSRAAREQEQVNAARDLDEARKWRRPKAKLSAEAEADRETVYSRFPELRPGK
ncbi:MAG TPA: P-loop NTPase fold protein [Candidatus Limnocylindrales bacterium]|nr:P-loop NTPase fold protein [Candidatus Limnocylindrales bacterium]